jgi:hypothetical protein
MKTYTQKQYDNAKKRAYAKGYEAGSELVTMDDIIENAHQIKEWRKLEQFDFDWTVAILIVVCLGVVIAMIV